MWNTLKHLTNKKRNTFVPPDPTAEQFNKYFVRIGEELGAKFDKESIPEWVSDNNNQSTSEFHFHDISIDSITEQIHKLPNRSNLDLLNMDSKLLLLSARTIAPFIAHLFNISITSGRIPNDWKIARDTPVFKNKGSSNDICTYI